MVEGRQEEGLVGGIGTERREVEFEPLPEQPAEEPRERPAAVPEGVPDKEGAPA